MVQHKSEFPSFKGIIIFHWMYFLTFISSSIVDTWVASTFWILWIMLAMNVVVKYVWVLVFNSFAYVPRSVKTGSYGNSIFIFFFWGTVILLPIVAAPLYILTSSVAKVTVSQHSCQHLLFSGFFVDVVLFCLFYNSHHKRYKVISHSGLICISLIISSIEPVFIYLLTISISSLDNYLFTSCSFLFFFPFKGGSKHYLRDPTNQIWEITPLTTWH